MSEDLFKIEDFSEPIRRLKGDKAGIFWDVERYPFPFDSTPDLIYQKIESAIRGSFSGEISIWAYVHEKGSSWGEFLHKKKTWKSRIYFLPRGDKRVRRNRMFHDILFWKMDCPFDPPHQVCLVVVSDEVRDDKMFFFKLHNMSTWYYNVFIVEEPTEDVPPPDSLQWPALLLDQAFSFTEQRQDACRKKLKHIPGTDDRSLDKTHKGSLSRKSPVLSVQPLPMVEDLKYYFSRADTHVFWNLEDYSIPGDVDSIYSNMTSALHRMGFHGWVGILAYGDKPKLSISELANAEIYYKPDMDEDSIVTEMSLDIIDWVAVTHPDPKNIVVIAKQDPEESEFHRVLKCLKSRNHTVLLVEPPHQASLFHSGLFVSSSGCSIYI